MKFKHISGGITAVPGFLASGVHAGLKKEKLDMAVIYNPKQCSAAGVFTTNVVKAAPLLLTMDRLAKGYSHGVVVNAGNANACNGPNGMEDAKAMASAAAKELGIDEEQMLVSSTGVIGEPMPMDIVLPGVIKATKELSKDGGQAAAEAIMTTDLVLKESAVKLQLAGKTVTIGGLAKGSGMIHPNMATMLGFIATDAVIGPETLKKALKEVVDSTYNMITVDGDTSTNDSVVMLASGDAGNTSIEHGTEEYNVFLQGLTEVCTKLAQDIAKDGEGATTLLEVVVKNAPTIIDARKAAKAVVGSNLFKCAVYGRDANWGRILCAVGYSGAQFNPNEVDIYIGELQVAENGGALPFDEEKASAILGKDKVTVTVDLKTGDHSATAWGCDLTYKYVEINGSYRT
ncbi:MAG: bifunctional glutamate N-acetyltransferase/amino-acid acetyltransferase ArgJ [Firmicutes bacterium]|nr:bifunctional glutamate N-acetyltransferase/amino-acid acetyltransferase ArgJ [Bacillota bacterium]